MKFLNRLKRIGYVNSLSEAMRLNEHDCSFSTVYIQISKTPKKSTFEYLMTTTTSNFYKTGIGHGNSMMLFRDDGFMSIDIAIGEITEQILLTKKKYPEMNTIFCYLNNFKTVKVFNYEQLTWEAISSEEFYEKYE